ncbi:unnamed protein product, partial [Iphiclides podalirius]
MIRYECEKRPGSSNSCGRSPAPQWAYGTGERARRPLPPRPIPCDVVPAKPTVPLKVWIIASASCFAVCAVLVLATVVVTQWGASERYPMVEPLVIQTPISAEPMYANPRPMLVPPQPTPKPQSTQPTHKPQPTQPAATELPTTPEDSDNEIQSPILEKLSIFKNAVGREKTKKTEDGSLASKPQLHPLHDTTLQHQERRIEKKDQAVYPGRMPHQKPTAQTTIVPGMRRQDADYYEEYYNDENLYEDYMQSNTMTSYLIEKVQELHEWITSDPDLKAGEGKGERSGDEFGQVLRALNDSLVAGDASIVMGKLKEIYLGDGVALSNRSRKAILGNGTDLLSFGILTLDVILLHNIQLMAWENQEAARVKMLKDPDVFAFNALFLEPGKVEAKRNEVYRHHENLASKRQNRPETAQEFDFGKNLLENVLEIGMSTARAAIHLGRAYRNTKLVLAQLSTRGGQGQLPRIDGAAQAIDRLQSSYGREGKEAGDDRAVYTDLDCIWTLYCKNLAATSTLNAPYGTMARINGLALRLLTGQLTAERALPAALHEALTGRADLPCARMLPRCSKVNAAAVVMDSIILPAKKVQSSNRAR